MKVSEFVYRNELTTPFWIAARNNDGTMSVVVVGDVNRYGDSGCNWCLSDDREVVWYKKHADSSWLYPDREE